MQLLFSIAENTSCTYFALSDETLSIDFASCCVVVLYSIEVRPEEFHIFHSCETNFQGPTTSLV
jgi:hypothetical protein